MFLFCSYWATVIAVVCSRKFNQLFFICTCFNARCSSHYGHFSTVQSIFRKPCLSFPLFSRFFLFALCSSLYIRRVPAREAHLSYLVVTSDQASSLSSLAAWAGTAEDICEEEEEELSKFELPTEGKVFFTQRAEREREKATFLSFGKAEYLGLLAWNDTFSPGASK